MTASQITNAYSICFEVDSYPPGHDLFSICILIDNKLYNDTSNCLPSNSFCKLFRAQFRFNIDEWICDDLLHKKCVSKKMVMPSCALGYCNLQCSEWRCSFKFPIWPSCNCENLTQNDWDRAENGWTLEKIGREIVSSRNLHLNFFLNHKIMQK